MSNISQWILDVRGIWEDHDSFYSFLQLIPDKTSQILAFNQHDDRKMALGSILLQKLWVCRHGVSWYDVHIMKDEHGRPWWQTNADFNISHHAGFVVLAGRDDGQRIGIDIVSTMPSSSVTAWMDDFSQIFTTREQKCIHLATDPYDAFMIHWAIKEAYVKAIGIGLTTDLQRIEVQSTPAVQTSSYLTIQVDTLPVEWQFELIRLEHMAIVTALAPPTNVHKSLQWITLNEIEKVASSFASH